MNTTAFLGQLYGNISPDQLEQIKTAAAAGEIDLNEMTAADLLESVSGSSDEAPAGIMKLSGEEQADADLTGRTLAHEITDYIESGLVGGGEKVASYRAHEADPSVQLSRLSRFFS